MATRTRKVPVPAPAAVTVAAAVEVVAAPMPATLDTLSQDIRDLSSMIKTLVGALMPTGTVTGTSTVKKIATAAPTAKGKAKTPAAKHRTPAAGETIEVGDLVSLHVSALKGKCGQDLSGIVTGVVLSLGSQAAKNRGDMPAGLSGAVLTIKLSSVRNVWAWTGDPRVTLTGKRIVTEETVTA